MRTAGAYLIAAFGVIALLGAARIAVAQVPPDVPVGTLPASVVPVEPIATSAATAPQLNTLWAFPRASMVLGAFLWSSLSRVPMSLRAQSAVVREPQRGSLRVTWGSGARVVKR